MTTQESDTLQTGALLADQDSFITEVTDEVRRDRLFTMMRRYGWIAILLVVVIVGGAAFNEWRKAQARAEAEALGDATLAALANDDAAARADALSAISNRTDGGRRAVLLLLQAASLTEAGDDEGAQLALETLSGDPDVPAIYRDIALLKSVIAAPGSDPEARIARLQPLAMPGNPLRLMALEQRAFAEIELGRTDAAIATLQGILADAERTEDLRRRASQLIVALGGTLEQG